MAREAASAPMADSATNSTDRVIRSSTMTVRIPPSISREIDAPRPTEGHSGVSYVARGTATSVGVPIGASASPLTRRGPTHVVGIPVIVVC